MRVGVLGSRGCGTSLYLIARRKARGGKADRTTGANRARKQVAVACVSVLALPATLAAPAALAAHAAPGVPSGLGATDGCARDGHPALGDKPDPFFLPSPDPDPFYAQPHPSPCLPPGTILDSRMIPFSPVGGVPMPQHLAWHLKFVSADTFGRPIAAVATVVKPMA